MQCYSVNVIDDMLLHDNMLILYHFFYVGTTCVLTRINGYRNMSMLVTNKKRNVSD